MDELKETDGQLGALTEGIEKNLVKAFCKLSAGLLNIPLQKIERHLAEKKADSNARIALTKSLTQRISEQLEVPEEYVTVVAAKAFGNIVQEQLQIESMLEKTHQLLQDTPQDKSEANRKYDNISDDWLNQFRESACQKSSEEAQELFSKVLAGEIRKPGSFSLLALTTLADMDQKVAELFNTFCSLCLVRLVDPDAFLSSNSFKIDDVRLPILRDNIIDAETIKPPDQLKISEFTNLYKSLYDKYGLNFSSFQLLLDHRLIMDGTYIKYNHFWYNNELWGFSPNSLQTTLLIPENPNITISGLALTSVGKELFHIIKGQTSSEYWKMIFNMIQDYYNVELINLSKPT